MSIRLPFEILTAIFEQVEDIRDLCHVRVVGRALHAAATPIVFRVLSVTNTEESAPNIGRVFDVPDIAAHVREVSFCDAGALTSTPIPEWLPVCSTVGPTFELERSFSRIHKLRRLEAINLTFLPKYGPQARVDPDGSARITLQTSILAALGASFGFRVRAPPKLILLSLHNLRTWNLYPLNLAHSGCPEDPETLPFVRNL